MGPVINQFTAKHIAEVCGCDLTTARRWRKGAIRPDPWVIALLTGDLGFFSDYWRGWTIRGEYIVSPENWTIRRNDALAVQLLHAQIEVLKAEVEKAKNASDIIEQPKPEGWDITSDWQVKVG